MATAGSQGTIAIDLDEVCCPFVPQLIKFHNATYNTSLKLSDFHSYHFDKVWGGTTEESTVKVQAFFESPYFLEMPLLGDAKEALTKLKRAGWHLVVVTSRQLSIEETTKKWIEKNFGDLFHEDDMYFGNHWGTTGKKRSKSDMCLEAKASILVDDSMVYAKDVASKGIKCFLFDLNGEYNWNKQEPDPDTDLVKRVHGWEPILAELIQ